MDADESNVRVLVDDFDPLGVAWSPDGTRLAFADGSAAPQMSPDFPIAPMDGAAPAEIGGFHFAGCAFNYNCDLTWSPDGSPDAFHTLNRAFVIDADGRARPSPSTS